MYTNLEVYFPWDYYCTSVHINSLEIIWTILIYINNETLIEIKTSMENLWQRTINDLILSNTYWCSFPNALQWRYNERDGGSNHQPHDCLLNSFSRRRSKKTSKLRVTGLCAGIHRGPMNYPHKGPVTWKMFPFDDVIMGSAWSGVAESAARRVVLLQLLSIHGGAVGIKDLDVMLLCSKHGITRTHFEQHFLNILTP